MYVGYKMWKLLHIGIYIAKIKRPHSAAQLQRFPPQKRSPLRIDANSFGILPDPLASPRHGHGMNFNPNQWIKAIYVSGPRPSSAPPNRLVIKLGPMPETTFRHVQVWTHIWYITCYVYRSPTSGNPRGYSADRVQHTTSFRFSPPNALFLMDRGPGTSPPHRMRKSFTAPNLPLLRVDTKRKKRTSSASDCIPSFIWNSR